MDDKNTNRTIEYYNTHADRYSEITRNADMSDIYKRFEEHLKPGSRILDLGCGRQQIFSGQGIQGCVSGRV